jgi:hypothetical protein
MQTETVFRIGGEGGGIKITRLKSGSQEIFIYHHNEFDPTDEGLDINKTDQYGSFEEAFEKIHQRYPWYSLYVMTVYPDYKEYVLKKLLEILNQKSVSPENFGFSRTQLEEVLDVELSYKVGELGEWGVKGLRDYGI